MYSAAFSEEAVDLINLIMFLYVATNVRNSAVKLSLLISEYLDFAGLKNR